MIIFHRYHSDILWEKHGELLLCISECCRTTGSPYEVEMVIRLHLIIEIQLVLYKFKKTAFHTHFQYTEK